MVLRILFLALAGLIAAAPLHGPPARARDQSPPIIAAAADLKFALEEVLVRFRAETKQDVRLNFGSSGNFTTQLLQGAPFEMFLSADEGFVLRLADAGLTLDRGALYAEGRIVLFAPQGSSFAPDAGFEGLRTALKRGRIQRFAIANPEHAPYGRAAEQALKGQGLWESIEPRLVFGENVAQAAQFATSGSTQGGIFAYSLAKVPEVSSRGIYVIVPTDWHAPLRQRMVLLKNAGSVAKAFFAYVQTPAAQAVFRRYGFLLPGEGS